MWKLVSVAEMVAVEKAVDKAGHTYDRMMEHAGHGLAEVVHARFAGKTDTTVLGLVGRGNNGGDTLVALAHLATLGWTANAYIVGERAADDALMKRLRDVGGGITHVEEDESFQKLNDLICSHAVLLDGLLGTGIRLPLRPPIPEVIRACREAINKCTSPPFVVAVDCPSGVDCDTGEAPAECLRADLTVVMAAVKMGLLRFPAYSYVGDIGVVGIGLPDDLRPWKAIHRSVMTADDARNSLPPRPLDAHKGTFGTALIVAGSLNYTGAALLAGQAAYRSGAGLVTLAVPSPLHAALSGQFPEATWILLPHESGVIAPGGVGPTKEYFSKATAVLLGPGFGLEAPTKAFLEQLLRSDSPDKFPPMVVDADGLKLLAQIPNWHSLLPRWSILTPHPGEMATLTGLSKDQVQDRRIDLAEEYAAKWGHVVVLKGAFTVVADPGGETVVIPVATPALARAGTGDVLAGVISGLRAQGMDAFAAAYIGAWLHAQAGLAAAKRLGSTAGVLAGDLILELPKLMAN